MKSLRLFLYFVIGLMLSMAAGSSFSASIQIGTYYQYGNQITRNVTSVADQTKLTQQMLNIAIEDSRTVGITTQFAYGMESGLIQGRILDTIKADSGVFTTMAENTVAGGLKAGLKGGLGGIAAQLLADALVTQGYRWMADAKCQVTAGCSTPGLNKVSTAVPSSSTQTWLCGGGPSCEAVCESVTQGGVGGFTFNGTQCVPGPAGGTAFTPGHFTTYSCPSGYTLSTDQTTCYPNVQTSTYTPVNTSDIPSVVDPIVINNLQPLVNAIAQDGTIISVPDSTPTSTSSSPVSGTPKTDTSTTSNPDGSTTTTNKTKTPTYTPQGDGTTGGPIQVITNNTTNTTTNTCTSTGSCTTTNNTTTKSDTPDTKTDCDKYPDSIGCSSFGTPSDADIPTSTQSTSLSWTALSVPSTCPPDIAVTYMGHPFSLSFKYLCQFAQYIKAMVIVSALIAAYFICFGARKETT